jgi:hypothetical protein
MLVMNAHDPIWRLVTERSVALIMWKQDGVRLSTQMNI